MFKWKKNRLLSKFSNDIGIDLGTANTLVYVRGKGIVVNEPSVVAVNQKTGQIVAIGSAAKEMLGRTPLHITTVRPLVDGVISDFEVTEEMLSYLMKRAGEFMPIKLLGPRVVVGVPSGVTNVEVRAVRDATKNAGAREVYIIEQPMAGAIGIRLPVHDPVGSMVIDIGGGTTDIAVVRNGGLEGTKMFALGGRAFTKRLAQEFHLTFDVAEQMKIDYANGRLKGEDSARLAREIVIHHLQLLEQGRTAELLQKGRKAKPELEAAIAYATESPEPTVEMMEAVAQRLKQWMVI